MVTSVCIPKKPIRFWWVHVRGPNPDYVRERRDMKWINKRLMNMWLILMTVCKPEEMVQIQVMFTHKEIHKENSANMESQLF